MTRNMHMNGKLAYASETIPVNTNVLAEIVL